MSGLDIPLWKQELLKRKQARLTHEKLHSPQKSNETGSKARASNYANSNSSVLNRHLTDSENRADFEIGKQNVPDKNTGASLYNTKKGSSHNRNLILDEFVDSPRTRQVGGESQVLNVDTGPSRLDILEAKPSPNKSIYNGISTISGSSNMHGMQASSRVPHVNKESNILVHDSSEKNRLKSLPVEQGVECEHISLRDVKKMWQTQATKDERLTKSHDAKKLTKENSRGSYPSSKSPPDQLNSQVSSRPGSVPKAYKSPYAKAPWGRSASVSSGRSIQKNPESSEDKKYDQKMHATVAKDDEHEKGDDGVEHIQSVKSLLGLFGGKARPSFNRKVSDNVVLGNKAEKDKEYHNSDIKALSQKRPGLFKHHSEPNLLFNSDNPAGYFVPASPNKSPTSPRKFPTSPRKSPSSPRKSPSSPKTSPLSPKKSPVAEVAVGDAILPSHHVSHGIQERLTRLQTASHSSIEEMDGFVEWQNDLNSHTETVLVPQNHEPQQNDIPVHILPNHNQPTVPTQSMQADKFSTVKTSVSNENQENQSNTGANTTQKLEIQQKDSFSEEPSRLDNISQNQQNSFNNVRETMVQNEKPGLSSALNTNNRLSGPATIATKLPSATVFHGGLARKNTQNAIEEVKNNLTQQPTDKFLPEFDHKITKRIETGSNLTDANEHKSRNKYENKQSDYAVETSQSGSAVHNDVMSTEFLTEIKQDKQDVKPVIKNQEIEANSSNKPRRKGLNIVDPLAVLQLTKDPILLKEQPPAAELGVFKESPIGKVQIIKHEPDRKDQIAQINRAWDLDNNRQTSKQNNGDMPASSIYVSPTKSSNVPVTSIDEIPVSVIGDFNSNKSNSNTNTDGTNAGSTAFYNGSMGTGLTENEGEFIPVSSIDDEVDLGPPPEIVFDKMPGNIKSCFLQNGKKRGKLSFFEHVFIHDYQSETAAASDWDFENGASFSSYTPAAVKQYGNVSVPHYVEPTPQPEITPPTPPEETRYDEPLITYNEEDSVDFSESSDSTAGALLF